MTILQDAESTQAVHIPAPFFFFFQAEDGIRDIGVTGVQTCALPIYLAGFITQGNGVAVEEDLVGEMDIQLARGDASNLHAGDLPELLLLLVHVVTGRSTEGGAGGGADDRAGAGIACLVAENGADDRAGHGADLRAPLGVFVRIVVGCGTRPGEESGKEQDRGFADHSANLFLETRTAEGRGWKADSPE